MSILKRNGFIEVDEDGKILLTAQGRKTAAAVYERHNLIADYLGKALGVEREIALEDACRIEHVISDEAFDKMKAWLSSNRKK
jgi:Mn-dependent DtxR family transcriptional regulator